MKHLQPVTDCPVVSDFTNPIHLRNTFGKQYTNDGIFIEVAAGGTLVIRTKSGNVRVLQVADGDDVPVAIIEILPATTEVIDGYPTGTATTIGRARIYLR